VQTYKDQERLRKEEADRRKAEEENQARLAAEKREADQREAERRRQEADRKRTQETKNSNESTKSDSDRNADKGLKAAESASRNAQQALELRNQMREQERKALQDRKAVADDQFNADTTQRRQAISDISQLIADAGRPDNRTNSAGADQLFDLDKLNSPRGLVIPNDQRTLTPEEYQQKLARYDEFLRDAEEMQRRIADYRSEGLF
jgi:hypothetical protein